MQHLLARKGAARIALIPPQVLEALNAGRIPTVNLNEFLALDLSLLARNVARDLGLDDGDERLQDTLAMLPAFPPMRRHLHVARALYEITRDGMDGGTRRGRRRRRWCGAAAAGVGRAP